MSTKTVAINLNPRDAIYVTAYLGLAKDKDTVNNSDLDRLCNIFFKAMMQANITGTLEDYDGGLSHA
ncbi:hypothetical protein [Piscirickettsia litoralis]|uniref:Uncharacterized protein n=1 Tax=Piscirickettsia litoralis TaxID=1891921 RepID=A0ABX2ZY17_9GAMM|nr:hypothetical protein [Piscirickettsia litoralis]ODN41383.1 hypothetical protein BGC07_16575 [Piscirickettsia litoralis]